MAISQEEKRAKREFFESSNREARIAQLELEKQEAKKPSRFKSFLSSIGKAEHQVISKIPQKEGFGQRMFGSFNKKPKDSTIEALEQLNQLKLSEKDKSKAMKHIIEKEYDVKRRLALEKWKLQKEREKQYGPGEFYIGGAKVPGLAKVNQYRNWQQEQELKRLKQETTIESQRRAQENARYYQAQLQAERERQSRESQRFETPIGMGSSFGTPLSMSGGMDIVSTNSQYPQEQRRDPMSMSLPIIGGLGANPFGAREEQPQQFISQPVQQPLPQTPRQPIYDYNPTNSERVQATPYGRTPDTRIIPKWQQNRAKYGTEPEPGSVFRKIPQAYGASYKKINPEEALPGEKLYRRVSMPYGHKMILIK